MAKFPTFRQADKLLKDAIPCVGCDCLHRSADVNVFLDEDTLRVKHFRLNCGKMPLVDLTQPDEVTPEPEVVEDDVVATSDTDGSDD